MSEIVWACDGCRGAVADGDGYIEVGYAERHAYRKALAAWKRANPGPAISGGALLDHPDLAEWRVWHRTCDPEPESATYWFGVQRARTPEAVLNWTLHMMETKRWLGETDWPNFVRRHLHVGAGRVATDRSTSPDA